MATVSVVIPSHNNAPFLEQAVRSAMGQTLHPLEVIVVDDASTDGSLELARKLGATALTTGTNAGPATARNIGIAAARGDLIAFLDADDYWTPPHREGLCALLARYPEAAVADAQARVFGARSRRLGAGGVEPPRDVLLDLIAGTPITQSSAMARRLMLQAVGGYRAGQRFAEDYDLWLRLARHHPFTATSAVTTMYRVHAGQISQSTEPLYLAAWEARRRLWDAVAAEGPAERLPGIELALVRAWEQNLRDAWLERDSASFLAVLALHPTVPGSRAAHVWWLLRAKLWRGPWQLAAAIWDVMPASMRAWRSPRSVAAGGAEE